MPAVLVVASDPALRAGWVAACRACGVPARGVGSIAEVERWPLRQTVVTDIANLTPLWRDVGASRVIVLVKNKEEGVAALSNGATDWIRREDPHTLLKHLNEIPAGH